MPVFGQGDWGGIQVIGAGLSRTGTLSLATALNRLGHRTFHGEHMFQDILLWRNISLAETRGDLALQSEALEQWVEKSLRGVFTATTDIPACLMYPELIARFPDAKVMVTVVLTVRDSPEQWAESVLGGAFNLGVIFGRPPFSWSTTLRATHSLSHLVRSRLFLGHPDDYHVGGVNGTTRPMTHERAARAYRDYTANVRRVVPADRLLVFNVKEGWGPLCRFLEVEHCPQEPFPRTNARWVLGSVVAVAEFITHWWPVLFLFVLVSVVMCSRWYCFGRRTKSDIKNE